MHKKKYSSWLWLLTAGIILIGIGFFAIVQPRILFVYLIKYTGYALIVSSSFLLIHAFTGTLKSELKWLICEGLLDLIFAAILIFNPFLATVALPLIIGSWVLIRGIIKLFHFIFLSKLINGRYYILAAGILSIIAGFFIVLLPPAKVVEVSYGMSVFALISGGLYIFDAFKFRNNEAMLSALV
jgi:uncharacterized membrane protein HdeD (DUF308 family)